MLEIAVLNQPDVVYSQLASSSQLPSAQLFAAGFARCRARVLCKCAYEPYWLFCPMEAFPFEDLASGVLHDFGSNRQGFSQGCSFFFVLPEAILPLLSLTL